MKRHMRQAGVRYRAIGDVLSLEEYREVAHVRA